MPRRKAWPLVTFPMRFRKSMMGFTFFCACVWSFRFHSRWQLCIKNLQNPHMLIFPLELCFRGKNCGFEEVNHRDYGTLRFKKSFVEPNSWIWEALKYSCVLYLIFCIKLDLVSIFLCFKWMLYSIESQRSTTSRWLDFNFEFNLSLLFIHDIFSYSSKVLIPSDLELRFCSQIFSQILWVITNCKAIDNVFLTSHIRKLMWFIVMSRIMSL